MLTSYLVKCPLNDCGWEGSLLPSRNTDSWKGPIPTVPIADFTCPKCGGSWKAKVKGDDVEPLVDGVVAS